VEPVGFTPHPLTESEVPSRGARPSENEGPRFGDNWSNSRPAAQQRRASRRIGMLWVCASDTRKSGGNSNSLSRPCPSGGLTCSQPPHWGPDSRSCRSRHSPRLNIPDHAAICPNLTPSNDRNSRLRHSLVVRASRLHQAMVFDAGFWVSWGSHDGGWNPHSLCCVFGVAFRGIPR
jgi:hypothetical protein